MSITDVIPARLERQQERRNIKLVIAYLGAAYHGWQFQPDLPTVQGAIEHCLQIMTQGKGTCRLRGAGRTDAGVHARGQVANFFTTSRITALGFFKGINSLLPKDIAILTVEDVPLQFDSRRDNQGKHYRYTIWNAKSPAPTFAAFSYHVYNPLDVDAMAEAARHFIGTHNFASFQSASCERDNPIRTLYRCTVCKENDVIYIDVEGTAFLKNMVRIIAGTLIDVGRGDRSPKSIPELIQAQDRTRAGMTAPAHGLTLAEVFFSTNHAIVHPS